VLTGSGIVPSRALVRRAAPAGKDSATVGSQEVDTDAPAAMVHAAAGHAPEYPERPLRVLRPIAVGSALAHGRTHVADGDLALISHIAMSSSGHTVARVLRALMAARGVMRTPELTEATELSAPTVRTYMELLQQKGVAAVSKGSPQTVELTSTYRALHEAPLLTTPPGC
jgi:hypothetical protein